MSSILLIPNPLRIVLFVLMFSGCRMTSPSGRLNEIIGSDDRVELKDAALLSRLGTIRVNGRTCNASLVNNDRVMTALHCVGADVANISELKFETLDGRSAKVLEIKGASSRKDIVIYKLDSSNFLSFDLSAASGISDEIFVVGYDQNIKKAMIGHCRIESKYQNFGAIAYRCDTTTGMSGAAVVRGSTMIVSRRLFTCARRIFAGIV